jgi:mevalonate kinase
MPMPMLISDGACGGLRVCVCVSVVSRSIAVRLTVQSEVPMGAGLGSSASYAAVLCAGFWHLQQLTSGKASADAGDVSLSFDDKSAINALAYECERIAHGTPSGIDNTCIVHGGVVSYRKNTATGALAFEFFDKLPPVRILVTNTNVDRSTKALVAGVGALKERSPSAKMLIE